jgi:hypothetical protein
MRSWLKVFLITIAAALLLFVSLTGPIDRTPLAEQSNYREMLGLLDKINLSAQPKQRIQAGWKKISITPDHVMPMAGYRIRKRFEGIHDSLYARIMVIHTAQQTVVFISVDLLLFPPALKEKISEKLADNNKPFLYLSATHTHNGIGGWHNTPVGNFALGDFDKQWIDDTSENIADAINEIKSNLQQASLSYWQNDAREYAENRLVQGAPYDGMLRGIRLIRSDSSMANIITFSAHATSLSKVNLELSGDYPAALVDNLSHGGEFAMFMAGMVGSHRLAGIPESEFARVAKAGSLLAEKVKTAIPDASYDSVSIIAKHIPIAFGPSQLRLYKNRKLRDWVFRSVIDPLRGELTYLKLNDIVLIGTPCDFSGELFVNHIQEVANLHNKNVIITSFNGDYTGYITEDSHYDTEKKEEVMTLNWVGPYYGFYFTEMINTLLTK